MESYRDLVAGFSTADAEHPSIEHRDGDLTVQFLDWREIPVKIHFPFTIAFRWQDEAVLPANIRDDQSYEVINSCWCAELAQLGVAQPQHRHYKLCFNAAGILDVVSHAPTVVT